MVQPASTQKSQIQALERTQLCSPLRSIGYVEGVTHGYTRHGTTTPLRRQLDVATGQTRPGLEA